MENKKITVLLIAVFITSLLLTAYLLWENGVLRDFKENNDVSGLEYQADTMEQVDELKKYNKPIIVIFGADYCPTCVNYEPYIKDLYLNHGDDIIVRHVNTVDHEAIRKEYNIELIPSTIFYDKDGKPFMPKADIDVYDLEETVEERKYVSDDIKVVTGDEMGTNKNFEFGVHSQSDEVVYTKYVGLIDKVQMEKIVKELIGEEK
ncbi:MAG: thioredoxin family protein [Clostridia bacterium]|nr:thioredoxin family protein [Clostridia bacterium]